MTCGYNDCEKFGSSLGFCREHYSIERWRNRHQQEKRNKVTTRLEELGIELEDLRTLILEAK